MSKLRNKVLLGILTALISVILLSGCKREVPYVILDCDMGCMNDDMLALSMLIKAEEAGKLKIAGITLEGGNNFIDASYMNNGEEQKSEIDASKEFLEKINRNDIPVIKGTDWPAGYENQPEVLAEFYDGLEYMPGQDEYGAIHYFRNLKSGKFTDSDDAADFMVREADKHPGNIVLIAIGPTMNIARAIRKDPSFAGKISQIYYMGGSFENKNVITPCAEYNVVYDAASFLTCITAGFKEQYISSSEIEAYINKEIADEIEKTVQKDDKIGQLWVEHYHKGIQDFPYWDPNDAAAFLNPKDMKTKECYVTVNTDRNDKQYAQTTAISPEEYNGLDDDKKELYGKVRIITGITDFWNTALKYL